MNNIQNLARIILRPHGDVHIAFKESRTIYATASNILELFSNPIDFINDSSYKYEESTVFIRRSGETIDNVLGLTLATVNSNKQISCEFSELFQFILNIPDNEKQKPLNMKDYKLESIFSDEKSYLLRHYLEFAEYIKTDLTINNNIGLSEEVQFQILRETLNSCFAEYLPEEKLSDSVDSKINNAISASEGNKIYKTTSKKTLVSLTVYCEKYDISRSKIKSFIQNNQFKTVERLPNGRYLLDINELPPQTTSDFRKNRKRKKSNENIVKISNSPSASEVQEHILEHRYFTIAIAKYIRTKEEMDYFHKNTYHEVCWDGRSALIIDVNPDYENKKGVSNRSLMKQGKPPHVPDRTRDDEKFHLHHIGQLPSSPFAIIPESDHNSKNLSKYFHPSAPKTELHGPEFELQKSMFWMNYIKYYDEAIEYQFIKYLNHRKDRASYKKLKD